MNTNSKNEKEIF